MTARWFGSRLAVFGAALAITAPLTIQGAEARTRWGHGGYYAARAVHAGMARHYRGSFVRYARWGRALQCVPFARENTGIELIGNANTWWRQAQGIYERGAKPEVGSILSFRSTGRMRLGHVAVVSKVIDGRNIEIDQANWGGPGRVTRDITVVDVSPGNDWSAVRVELGSSPDGFGSVYPTYGFIYDRPDGGTMVANAGVSAKPVQNDLRLATDQVTSPVIATATEEVAEAPDEGDEPAPRAYRHRSFRRGHVQAHVFHAYTRGFQARARGLQAQSRGFHAQARGPQAPRASVYRVSSRGFGVAKPQSRRHRS